MSFFGKIAQNVVASTLNSSTGILAGYGEYTGSADSTLGVAATAA